MSSKESLKANSEQIKEIITAGMNAIKRVSTAIETKTTDTLNFDAEKILGRGMHATVNAVKTEIALYRVINDKMF
jgi:hypothetical protein